MPATTVQAINDLGDPVPGYTGTVHFASSDGTATLPANYTFTATDAGVHTFTNAFTLRKRGTQTITVTDVVKGALTATDGLNVL
jgi:adhesin/invasin